MTNLTREQLDCLAEAPWNAYDLASIHKDSLASLVSMARELLELRERAKGSAEEVSVRLMTECTKEVKGYDAEKASRLIQAWHEAQLPVVSQEAEEFADMFLGFEVTPMIAGLMAKKLSARDAALLSSYKESWDAEKAELERQIEALRAAVVFAGTKLAKYMTGADIQQMAASLSTSITEDGGSK